MDEDMRKSLLNKKSANFDKQYQDCIIKIQRIKQKNDFMQKQVGTDVQESIRAQVTKQKQFLQVHIAHNQQKQIKQLKNIMDDMDKKFKDPQSKNKLKTLKMDAQKQIQRNKVILKDLINKSFMMKSHGSTHSDQDVNQYIEGGVNYNQLQNSGRNRNRKDRQQQNQEKRDREYKDQSLITDQNIDMDFQVERKILQEKKQLLDVVEQSTVRVNNIMNDMALMVDQQGENLQVISEELMKTNKNLVETNKQLSEANTLQKKSRRKYVLFMLLMLVLIAGVVGVIFLTQ